MSCVRQVDSCDDCTNWGDDENPCHASAAACSGCGITPPSPPKVFSHPFSTPLTHSPSHPLPKCLTLLGKGGEFTFCSAILHSGAPAGSTRQPPAPPPPKNVEAHRTFGCCMHSDPRHPDECHLCQSFGETPQQRASNCHTSRGACALCAEVETGGVSWSGLYCEPPPLLPCEQLGARVEVAESWKDHLDRDVAQLWVLVPSWAPKAEVRVSFPSMSREAQLIVQNIEGASLKQAEPEELAQGLPAGADADAYSYETPSKLSVAPWKDTKAPNGKPSRSQPSAAKSKSVAFVLNARPAKHMVQRTVSQGIKFQIIPDPGTDFSLECDLSAAPAISPPPPPPPLVAPPPLADYAAATASCEVRECKGWCVLCACWVCRPSLLCGYTPRLCGSHLQSPPPVLFLYFRLCAPRPRHPHISHHTSHIIHDTPHTASTPPHTAPPHTTLSHTGVTGSLPRSTAPIAPALVASGAPRQTRPPRRWRRCHPPHGRGRPARQDSSSVGSHATWA